jgi:hypothetical protein
LEVVTVEPDGHELELDEPPELPGKPVFALLGFPPSKDARKEVKAKFTIVKGYASD